MRLIKNWFIKAANKIRNKYKFKPAKILNIFKINCDASRLLMIGSSKDKIVQKALSIIFNRIYEYEDKVFLKYNMVFAQDVLFIQHLKE